VIVDAPPLLPVIDGAVLSALADGCLVVARFARTTRDQLAEATATVMRVHADVLGLVLNRVPGTATTTPARRKDYAADSDRRRTRHLLARTSRPPDPTVAPDPDALPITGSLPTLAPRTSRPAGTGP